MKNREAQYMFDRIARRYDLLNHLLSLNIDRSWRRKLVRTVVREQPRNVLDVATGTADVAIAIKQKLPNTEVIGVDLSEGMLDIGREKVKKRNLDIDMMVGNGENLSFEADSFDAITIAFGIRNFDDKERGLQEFARVLRSGSSVHILEFSTPKRGFFAWCYRVYFHKILPSLGRLISKDMKAYNYLPASVDNFPNPQDFILLMQKAGFTDCRARKLTFGIAYIYSGKK